MLFFSVGGWDTLTDTLTHAWCARTANVRQVEPKARTRCGEGWERHASNAQVRGTEVCLDTERTAYVDKGLLEDTKVVSNLQRMPNDIHYI